MGGVLHDHVVTFYDREADLVGEIAEFVAAGLDGHERVLLVTTPEHRVAIDDVLVQFGVDAEVARSSGRLQSLDAAELLRMFMSDAGPDQSLFAATVGGLIEDATADGSRVRIYGEMVAVLWAENDVAGALQLETLWNTLSSTHEFTLLCGYPTSVLDASLTDAHEVCAAHTHVMAPRSYGEAGMERLGQYEAEVMRASEVFLPVAAAIPAARRFVAQTLRSWHEDSLVPDGMLIASELATNAVRHAGSPFRISLHRGGPAIRIAIEDVDAATPKARNAEPDASGGRGVHIVEELARTWGWDPVTPGKVVWAELAPSSSDR
jgi:anti-sigma regulatory factor (Ser/Thr protein kinase)